VPRRVNGFPADLWAAGEMRGSRKLVLIGVRELITAASRPEFAESCPRVLGCFLLHAPFLGALSERTWSNSSDYVLD
jgi:hypothetical protein